MQQGSDLLPPGIAISKDRRRYYGLGRSKPDRAPRSRAVGSESISWALTAVELAARVRRSGARPGAGGGVPYRRRRHGAAAAFAARLLSDRRRSQSADHL